MFDLRRLEAFVAFAESRSFTQAARTLHVTQPAVHMQIAKLEEELAVTLYRRVGNTLSLTPEGERVAAFGRDVGRGAQGLEAALRGDDREAAPLALAAGEGAFLYLLGPALRAFVGARASQTASPLKLLPRDGEGALAAVREGLADVGVAPVPPSAGADRASTHGLAVARLCDVPQIVALPKAHPLAARRRLRPADLAGVPMVVPPRGRPHRTMIDTVLAAEGLGIDVAVEASGWEVTLHFVRLGLGIAVVNAYCRIPAGVVTRPLAGFPAVPFSVVKRRGIGQPARVERLTSVLHAHADAWRHAR